MSTTHFGNRLLRNWVVRLVIAVFAVLLAVLLRDILMGILARVLKLGDTAPQLWSGRARSPSTMTVAGAMYSVVAFLTMAGLGFGFYALYARRVEKRTPSELSPNGAAAELAVGTLLGLGIILVVIAVLAAAGDATIARSNAWLFAVPGLAYAATAACMEEIALRGVVLRILEKGLGTWGALALSAATFGVLHARNENASWTSTLSIAVTGGLVLGFAYVVTRRLWLAIGLHFGANAAQGGMLGLPVSGHEAPGLFQTRISGPDLLTGGAFGVEASVVLLVVALLLAGVLLRRAVQLGHIVPAPWSKRGRVTGHGGLEAVDPRV
jgi:CAAX protease family protein